MIVRLEMLEAVVWEFIGARQDYWHERLKRGFPKGTTMWIEDQDPVMKDSSRRMNEAEHDLFLVESLFAFKSKNSSFSDFFAICHCVLRKTDWSHSAVSVLKSTKLELLKEVLYETTETSDYNRWKIFHFE